MNLLALLIPVIAVFPAAAPKLNVTLIPAANMVSPGDQTELAIRIQIEKGWHIYDPIVLDTGAATEISFALPPGVTTGELLFPSPYAAEEAGLRYLSHEDEIVVLTTLKLGPDAPAGPFTIRAKVYALACKQLCFPVSAEASLTLNDPAVAADPKRAEFFKDAREALPKPLARAPYIEGSSVAITPEQVQAGHDADVVLKVRVKKAHHIQAPDPGVADLIGARLYIEPLDGLEFGDQRWPTPHAREMPGFGKANELSGNFEVHVPVRIIDDKFASGPIALRVLFTYQTCTDSGSCYAPETTAGVLRFTAETANPATPSGVIRGTLYASPLETKPGAETTPSPSPTPVEPAAPTTQPAAEFTVPVLTAADWADHIPWQTWKPGLPESFARQGHMVYVDFTATWCATCQTNKKLSLETEAVRNKMRDLGVIPVHADFTNRNAAMQRALGRWRPTVPVNVIYYQPDKPDEVALLPVVLTPGIVIDALEHPEKYPPESPADQSLLFVLLGGFLGGLILNVMPCVLPVISIKIVSFVQQAGEDPGRVFRLGLAFCAGIMVWFWAFAALAAAGNIPWQYPEVVVALGSVIFLFSLNLFGVFELMLPGAAAGQLGQLAGREGYSGAFLKGFLATLLGTACTAPFLAGAMAYALTQPWQIVFLVFSAAGLGMATPYLILTARPAWLKFLPKPGAWMVTFKQAAGFVLLGTAIWLLSILAAQRGADGVVWTVAFWGFLALAAWMLGKGRPTWETSSRLFLWVASLAVVGVGFWFCYFVMYDWSAPAAALT